MGGMNHTKSKLFWIVICQFSFCDNADAMKCLVMGVWELGIKEGANPSLLAVGW